MRTCSFFAFFLETEGKIMRKTTRTNTKLNMETVKVKDGDLFAALISLSDLDNDFNGRNGEEYLSTEAREYGCESNQEYLVRTLSEEFKAGKFEEEHEVVDAFCERWCGADDFFEEYAVVCDCTPDGCVKFIALSYIQKH